MLDTMNNSKLLNKYTEKKTIENNQKIKDFYERNLEFRERKRDKLEKKIEQNYREKVFAEIKPPNNHIFDKAELRGIEEFYKEQMKYSEARFFDIKKRNEDKEKARIISYSYR